MKVKPQLQLAAIVLAAALSYGIVSLILSHPLQNMPGAVAQSEKVKENHIASEVFPGSYFFAADGRKASLDDYTGRPVLVNLWATWCPPCVGELPSLDRLELKLKDRNIAVVAISLDRGRNGDKVTQFLSTNGITHLDAYWDKDGKIREQGFGDALPVTFLVGSNGKLIWRAEGPYIWDKDDMVKKLKDLAK